MRLPNNTPGRIPRRDATALCYNHDSETQPERPNPMQNDNWLTDRVAFLKALKSRTDQQELLVLLAEKSDRSALEDRKLATLVKAEKAALRAAKARQDAARMINADRKAEADAERKARDHEMYQAAGLLSLAGLVDKKTGKPTVDRGELLGALLGLAKVPPDDQRRGEWKRAGDALLAAPPRSAD